MKKIAFVLMLFVGLNSNAQIKVENGPELDNNRDMKMNRMIQGEDDNFYCYRIRTKGLGTSFYIEKYSKQTLKPEFSKEINIDEAKKTDIENVLYAAGKIYIFRSQFFRKTEETKLYYQTVSADGVVAEKLNEITSVKTDHYTYIDFNIIQNALRTKFLIKITHKANKTDEYKTDFILLNTTNMEHLWEKRVDQKLFSSFLYSTIPFVSQIDMHGGKLIGLRLDDNDNVYYAYSYLLNKSEEKNKRYHLAAGILESNATSPKIVDIHFDEDYGVSKIMFSKTEDNQLVIGGFLREIVEQKRKDLIKVGVFSFKIDVATAKISSQNVKMFDIDLLKALRSRVDRPDFEYKLDYIFPIGKDIFFVGEKYEERVISFYNFQTHSTITNYDYEYQDVIVAKFNSEGEFEWIQNTPLRINMTLSYPHIFKQYFAVATDKNIYIFYNENSKNLNVYKQTIIDPDDFKSLNGVRGSSFVCTDILAEDGRKQHLLVFNNENYCFAPIQENNPNYFPPSDCEIFVKDKNNNIFIYTENHGRDRFTKIFLEE